RFYQAARQYAPRAVVRLTGDCPLHDPGVIDQVIDKHLSGGFDYTSNIVKRSYPDGLDTEVMEAHCLEIAWREAQLPSEREHVTPIIYHSPPELFHLGHVVQEPDLSYLRWVVDEQADFSFISAVYEALYPVNPIFTTADVLALLEHRPDIATMMGKV